MRLKFSIRSSTHYLAFLRKMISSVPKLCHKDKMACALALTEAVNNAIFHAHAKDERKWIDIEVIASSKSIEMRVSDSGKGFTLPEADVPLMTSPGGRGIFLMRAMMESVKYKKGNPNILKMVYRMED